MVHEENRVFDVSKPGRASPTPTSRPVIVGHHPLNDPMVRNDNLGTEAMGSATKIPISDAEASSDGGVTVEQAMAAHQEATEATDPNDEESNSQGSPAIFSDHEEPSPAAIITPEPDHPQESIGQGPFTSIEPDHMATTPSDLPLAAPQHEPDIEGLHFDNERPRKGGRLKWVITGLLALIIAAYLLIDAGIVGAGLNLPFHIFKQDKTDNTATTPLASHPVASGPVLPAGFKEYKLADTNLTFAAPLSWGDPTSTTDPGYSKRSTGAQPDGTYAYLVNFATNKDVQIAVTSSKYLPAARSATYYDYLQWCLGTNDNQFYESVLNFSTANKIDTPTTITCNQGPVAGATKINASTIVQAQAKDPAGKVIGDIYTMNLKDPALVVFRVKDAVMTNGTDIKQILNTVQVTGTTSSNNSTTSQ